jgi:6-phosphogluconolactonase
MTLIEYADREMMMMTVAQKIASELRMALQAHPTATLAVAGGMTPGPVFDSLCAADIDWGRVFVVPPDERWLPASAPRSNGRLIRARLLQHRAQAARLVPLYAEDTTPEAAEPRLAEAVEAVLPLAVCLLGMGADLHTASLFPGAERLEAALAADAPAVLAIRAPGAAEPRMTLSARVLGAAMNLHILIAGPEKRAALERAEAAGSDLEAPVRRFLASASVHWAA